MLVRDKDYIINKEVSSLTDSYEIELKEKNKKIAAQNKILNDPVLLKERVKDIEIQRQQAIITKNKELLEKLENDILSEAKFKLQRGEDVGVREVDDCIRTYAPKEKLGVYNPWEALDIITERKKFEFEDGLRKKIEELKQEIENKKQEQREGLKREIEQIRPQSRGRRR